jgi:hypothetical protein
MLMGESVQGLGGWSGSLCKLLARGRLVSEEFGLGIGLHTLQLSLLHNLLPGLIQSPLPPGPLERRAREDADHSFQKNHA